MRILIAILVSLVWLSQGVAAERPNVLILLTDDQGYGDLSVHGNPVLKTPNLDQLAREAIRLVDFHSAPMCTPTRGQLMTGMDALRNGATSVTAGRAFVRPGIKLMPEYFASAGYRTGIFGKWHLGDNYPHRPGDRGFQEAIYHLGWGFTSAPEFANTLFDGRYFDKGMEKRFTGHCTDFWFDQAMQWMRDRKDKGEPFLCYLPTNAPHAPHVEAEEFVKPYDGRGPAAFFGMISHIDHNVGRLEEFLRKSGLRDNTIVIYMTDNGGTAGVRIFNAGMRGRKTEYYDGGHRVPCFVRWPNGNLRQPGEISVPAQMQDILPTLLEFCGIPASEDVQLNGVSLAELLRGKSSSLADRMLVVQYGQNIQKWDCEVIWGQWRLFKGQELYDIHSDPAQQMDIAAKNADVVAKMKAHYEKWWSDLEPRINDFVPTILGSEKQEVVALTSSDWESIYCDNAGHVRNAAGGSQGGHWHVQIERDGEYEFALRRWPREIDLPLGGLSGEGKVLPISAARLTVADQALTAATKPVEKEVVIRAKLTRGKTKLHAWFQDAEGKDLSGAFYAYVRRLDP